MKKLFHIIWKEYKCYVTAVLVLINMAVFGWMFLKNSDMNPLFLYDCGAMMPDSLAKGDYYRLITAMFLHFDLQHLGNNMLMLAAIGSTTERYMGSLSFTLIYFIGGTAGNIFSAWSYTRLGENVVAAGASGAIFAVVGALLCLVLFHKGQLENFTTKKLVLFIVLILYQGFSSEAVDNYAHTGGLVIGFLVGMICILIKRGIRQISSNKK